MHRQLASPSSVSEGAVTPDYQITCMCGIKLRSGESGDIDFICEECLHIIKKFHYGCGVASECIVGMVKMSEESGSYIC